MRTISHKRCILWAVLSLVILMAVYVSYHHGDYHILSDLEDTASTFAVSAELETYLLENVQYTIEDVEAGLSTFEGVRYESIDVPLYDTEYTMHFRYTFTSQSGTEGILLIADHQTIQADHSDYELLYSAALIPTGASEVVDNFTLLEQHNTVVLRIVLPADAVFHIDGITLQSTSAYFSDGFFKVLFIVLVMGMVLYLFAYARSQKARHKNGSMVCVCGLIAVFATLPHMATGLSTAHDMAFHVSRIEGIAMSMREGTFSIQMNPFAYNQYGYPDGVYYPYLFLFFPAALRLLNASPLFAYKALIFLSSFATACVGGFVGFRLTKSRKTGIVFCALYTLAMYRLTNICVRGAVGEVLAMIFMPLAFYGIHSLLFEKKKAWVALALGMVGLINSHVLSVVFAVLFMGLYALVHAKRLFQKPTMIALVKAVLLTVGLTAWWVIPFLGWLSYGTVQVGNSLVEQTAHLSQIFHQFTFYNNNMSNYASIGTWCEMPITIGIVPLLGVIFYSFMRFYLIKDRFDQNRALRALVDGCFVGFVLSIFLSSTSFPYYLIEIMPSLSFVTVIEFPWRFLGMATLFGAMITAVTLFMLIKETKEVRATLAVVAMVAVAVVSAMPFFETTVSDGGTHYINSSSLIYAYGDSLYLPVGFENFDDSTLTPFYECADETVSYENCVRDGLALSCDVINPSGAAQVISIPLFGYPNSYVMLDGNPLTFAVDEVSGRILVTLPEGTTQGTLTAGFFAFDYYLIGYVITACTGIGCIVWLIGKKRKNKS